MMIKFTVFDRLCLQIDQVLRTLGNVDLSTRETPAKNQPDVVLTKEERRHAAGLMRVNHTGEVCAQALYQGQALTAKQPETAAKMQKAAHEENDHLAWCHDRLVELGSHTSYLNPFWYMGSFFIGAFAGVLGDQWSLGFVAETEKQVVLHLQHHQSSLPAADLKSLAIVKVMEKDEARHQQMAEEAGAQVLPKPVKKFMGLLSKIMVKTVYHI